MGYRSYLGRVNKADGAKYRDRSFADIEWFYGELTSEAPYRPIYYEQLYELGKYCDFREGREPFYTQFDVYEKYESEFDILSKDGLRTIIESEHNDVLEDYRYIYNKKDQHEFYFNKKINEWDRSFGILPYYLDQDETDGFLVRSWNKEYAIFNLVYIYRTFDFDKDYLIYSAW